MIDFKYLFKIPLLAMSINGSNPYQHKGKAWALKFFVLHGTFTTAFLLIIYNIIYHDLKINNFSQACKNGVLSVLYVVVTYQYCILLYHRHPIKKLIDDVENDFTKHSQTEDQLIMSVYAKRGFGVCKQWLVLSCCAFNSFLFKNIIIWLYYYCIGEFRFVQFYDVKYPTYFETYSNNVFVFWSMYFVQMLYGLICSVMYVGFVPLGPIFMLHACGQLELIIIKVNKIFDESDDAAIMDRFKDIIMELQYIYSFVERITACFKVCFELTFKATTILLPVACYEVLESFKKNEFSLEFVSFIIGGTLINGSPCLYSELLMEKGEELRLALYCCGWERHYNRRARSIIELMLMRALRPIGIRTMFRLLCLEALTELFRQSFAIFNLLNAIWE